MNSKDDCTRKWLKIEFSTKNHGRRKGVEYMSANLPRIIFGIYI